MLIQHLEDVQQAIVKGNELSGVAKSEVFSNGKTGYIDHNQLLDDINDILSIGANDSELVSVESHEHD